MHLMTVRHSVFVVELKKYLLLVSIATYTYHSMVDYILTTVHQICTYNYYMAGMQALLQFGLHEPHWWMIIGILYMWLPK